jgi:carbamoyltransferase
MMPIDWNPSQERLRRFGLVATVVFAYGAFRVFHGSFPWLDTVASVRGVIGRALVAVALGSLGCSLVFPRGNRPLYVSLMLVTAPVAVVVSTLVLGLVFFGIVTPIGILRRLLGADPLGRRFDLSRTSYWIDALPSRPLEDYFKLF